MFKKLKFLIYTKAFSMLAFHIIQIYSLTFRLDVVNEKSWQALLKKGKTVLLCTWHQQFFTAIRHFKRYRSLNPALMISKSKDGDLIAGVARRTGWHTARGSSSRGGKKAMEAMIEHLKKYRFGAHILDGPQGPIGSVKAGAIKMAHEGDAYVVPFHVSAENAWYFNSWDRFMLPKPFSKVTLIYGEKIRFDETRDPELFESQRAYLEETMKPMLVSKPR